MMKPFEDLYDVRFPRDMIYALAKARKAEDRSRVILEQAEQKFNRIFSEVDQGGGSNPY